MARVQIAILILCIALLTIIVHAGVLRHGFVTWDDGLLVYRNPTVQEFSPTTIKRAFTSYDPELYIPLTLVSYQIEHMIAGQHPALYHVDNLLLHTANALLVFWLVFLLFADVRIACVAGVLFGIHPLHTEAVAWVSARKDLLSTFFFLASAVAYCLYRKHDDRKSYIASVVFFALSLLAKVTTLTLPVVFLLIDWYHGRTFDRRTWLEKAPYALLSIAFFGIALGGKAQNIASLGILKTFLLACGSIVFVLGKLLWPLHLSVIYPFAGQISPLDPWFALSVVGVIGLIAAAYLLRNSVRVVTFSIAFFLLTLAPTLATFNKAGEIYIASDRYAYIPSIGVIALVAFALWKFWLQLASGRRWLLGIAAVNLLLSLSLMSVLRTAVWADSETLYRDALEQYPDSASIRYNLGLEEERQGRFAEALADYRMAIAIRPDYADAHNNIGVILLLDGKVDEAIVELQKAIAINPRHPKAHANLGEAYGKKGMYEEGLREARIALELEFGKEKADRMFEELQRQQHL